MQCATFRSIPLELKRWIAANEKKNFLKLPDVENIYIWVHIYYTGSSFCRVVLLSAFLFATSTCFVVVQYHFLGRRFCWHTMLDHLQCFLHTILQCSNPCLYGRPTWAYVRAVTTHLQRTPIAGPYIQMQREVNGTS